MIARRSAIVAALAPSGKLRAAINVGNSVLARVGPDGALSGRSVDIARAIATALDQPLALLSYPSTGATVDAGARAEWDIAFLAMDPARAEILNFSAPYITIETGIAVALESPLYSVDEIDQPGVRISAASGAAYELHLRRTLRSADLATRLTYPEAVGMLRDGRSNAVAGLRDALSDFVLREPGFRLLDGVLTRVDQAIATPCSDGFALAFLDGCAALAADAGPGPTA